MSFLIGVGRKHFRNFSYMVCPKLILNLKCRLLALSTAALSTLAQQTSVGHWSSCSSESENHLKIWPRALVLPTAALLRPTLLG